VLPSVINSSFSDHPLLTMKAAARLQKIRHERTRNRTRERALLSAEQLTEAMVMATNPSQLSGSSLGHEEEDSLSSIAIQRISLAFTVWFPLNVGSWLDNIWVSFSTYLCETLHAHMPHRGAHSRLYDSWGEGTARPCVNYILYSLCCWCGRRDTKGS
jgi:hypothetical protein